MILTAKDKNAEHYVIVSPSPKLKDYKLDYIKSFDTVTKMAEVFVRLRYKHKDYKELIDKKIPYVAFEQAMNKNESSDKKPLLEKGLHVVTAMIFLQGHKVIDSRTGKEIK